MTYINKDVIDRIDSVIDCDNMLIAENDIIRDMLITDTYDNIKLITIHYDINDDLTLTLHK